MRLRSRLLVVSGLFALFVLAPGVDSPADRSYGAQLRVREWLLAADGPLAAWRVDGSIPALRAEVRRSPPIVDAAERRAAEVELERAAVEWAAGRTAERLPTNVDAARGALPLLVRVGADGMQAELPGPDGAAVRLVAPFATRWSLLPALVAIGLAVLTTRVLVSLLLGCLAGAIAFVATALPGQAVASVAATGLATPLGGLEAVWAGLHHFAVDALWHRSIGNDFYLRITLFVVFLFLTIGVITQNGGVHGLVRLLQRRVSGPVGTQRASFAAGLLVFFDDYTNCLLVGSSMRPLCDATRVSREKLAYIVDSTAAPVAGLSVFSTWVVYEMSQYRGPLALVTRADGTPYVADDAFAVFLQTIPFRSYCLFALLMVLLVVMLRRDFGPMLAAERQARRAPAPPPESLAGPSVRPASAVHALLPLSALVVGTVGLMLVFGWRATSAESFASGTERLQAVLANARSDEALLIASITAFVLACTTTLLARLLPVGAMVRAALRATRPLGVAFAILFLAWSLGHLCRDLGTSIYLTTAVQGAMVAAALPATLFAVAGAISFATGTSFGTMAILLPNVVVLAHRLGEQAEFTGSAAAGGPALMLLCIGAVLEGAIFGDHCSPISDTTVLSSVGAQCGLVEHVKTQMPYALLCAGTSLLCVYVPLGCFGPQLWPVSLLAGAGTLAACLWWFGRDPEA